MIGILVMNERERNRKSILKWFRYGRCTLKEVSKRMQLSYCQAKRVW